MGETKAKLLDRILKWLSNEKNAAIFASIFGIVASAALMAVKIYLFALSPRVCWSYMADFPLFLISSLFFYLPFRGLKKERESIFLISIFAQAIVLLFVGSDALLLLYTLIADPGCIRYWPFFEVYRDYDTPVYSTDASTTTIFQYTAYDVIVYFVMSCGLYRTIWCGYKLLKLTNLKSWQISPVKIPAVSNTHYIAENIFITNELASPVFTIHQMNSKISHLETGRLFLATKKTFHVLNMKGTFYE